jgi:hypothetical protein
MVLCSYCTCTRTVYIVTRRTRVRHAAITYPDFGELVVRSWAVVPESRPHHCASPSASPAIDPPRTGFAASIDLATRHYCTPTTVSEDRIPEPPGTFLDKPVRHTHTPEASATSRYETFRTSTDPHVWVRLYNMGSVGYSHGRAAPTPPEACAIKPNTKSCTLDRVATNVAHAGYVVASYAAVAILGSPAGAR